MRTTQGDMSIQDLHLRQTDIDFEPWYQRPHVWTPKKDSLLIDTILRKWDIPKIYLRVVAKGKYEIVDGHQRLLAIFNFLKRNGYSLVGDVICKGMTFTDLDEKKRNEILRFRLQIVFVDDATEGEISEMFQRLQLGMGLNSGEKLNAISGDMSNFVKELAKHPFFPGKTYLSEARFSFLQAAAQMVHRELYGLTSAKFENLKKMYEAHKKFSKDLAVAKQVRSNLRLMNEIVPNRSDLLSNRAVVTSFYDLVSTLCKGEYDITGNKQEVYNAFFDFLRELRRQVQMGIYATDTQLMEFQLNVIQGADSGTRIRKRHDIIFDRLRSKLNLTKKQVGDLLA